MCRIDAPFGDRPLDEKKDPTERFLQALDEFNVEGNFRALLIKHFSVNWVDVFYNASNLEDVLKSAKKKSSEPKKCIDILLSRNINHRFRLKSFHNDMSNQNPLLLDFLNDVADTYFPGSPLGLYQAGMEGLHHDYFLFVHWLHGEEYFFTKEFFDDKTLNSIGERGRTAILWDCFYSMAQPINRLRHNLGESSLLKGLTSIASSNVISGPLTEESLEILRGLEFIKTWVKFDSQAGKLSYNSIRLFYSVNSPWNNIESLLRKERSDCEETSDSLHKWLNDTKRELETLLYVNADLHHSSDIDAEEWASNLDRHFGDIYRYFGNDCDFRTFDTDKFNTRLKNSLSELCSLLTPLQISTWIKWSVKEDFQSILNSNELLPSLSKSAERWGCKEYFGTWKILFLESINGLELTIRRQLTCPVDDN